MPVGTQATVKADAGGSELAAGIIRNTYHLWMRPGHWPAVCINYESTPWTDKEDFKFFRSAAPAKSRKSQLIHIDGSLHTNAELRYSNRSGRHYSALRVRRLR